MLSIEHSRDIARRLNFNRPFNLVNIELGDIGEYVPQLSPDIKHLLWLDYDQVLDKNVIDTIFLAASQLSTASILIVTIDVEPPGMPEDGPKDWKRYFLNVAADYLPPNPESEDFIRSKLPKVNAEIIDKVINSGLAGREGVSFLGLFNFLYADKHQMLTLGGMIGTDTEKRKLRSLNKKSLPFMRTKLTGNPYKIRVPKITRKERLYLDSAMPCKDNWKPKEFDMKKEDIIAYRKIYKYYPFYIESLM